MLFCSELVEARLTNSTISLKQVYSDILLHSGILRLSSVALSFMFTSFKSSQLLSALKSLTAHTEHTTSNFQRLRGLPHKELLHTTLPLPIKDGFTLVAQSTVTFECRFTNAGFI